MASINIANIRRMDLNLLLVFQCLMNERSVTKAANALFLTQGAVSASLRKLRVVFNDELFTRGSHGMTPELRSLEKHLRAGHVRSGVRSQPLQPGFSHRFVR